MKIKSVVRILVVSAGLALPQAGVAQQAVAVREASVTSQRILDELLSRPVSVSLTQVPLWKAIDVVSANVKVPIQYQLRVVEQYPALVSLNVKEVTLRTVLERLFAKTGLRVEPDGASQLVVVAAQGEVTAQNTGIITGKVVNAKTQQPIAGATVSLGQGQAEAKADQNGTFRIVVNPGEYQVTVRAVGFVKQVKAVSVVGDKTVATEFKLEPSASVLDEVIVTGTVVATERRAVATPITVITAEDIEKRGITRIEQLMRGEVPGLLALDRGIATYSGMEGLELGSSAVYARGSAGLDGGVNPIKTFVDGVEIFDHSYLGMIDPSSIERIEIITGPQAATVYGSGAMGGVMQIFTKKTGHGSAPELTLNLKYGMLQSNMSNGLTPSHNHSAELRGGSGPGFSYSLSGSYTYSGQWQPALFSRRTGFTIGATTSQGPFIVSGSASFTIGSNGTYFGGAGVWSCGINQKSYCVNSLLGNKWAESGQTTFPSLTLVGSQRISRSNTELLAFNIDYRPTGIWQHHLSIGRNRTRNDLEPVAPRWQDTGDSLYQMRESSGLRTSGNYNFTLQPRIGPLSIIFSSGISGSWGKRASIEACLAELGATTLIPCGFALQPLRPAVNDSWGGFGNWRLGLYDRFFVTLGLRGEKNPAYGEDHSIDWTPTSGVTYTTDFGFLSLKTYASYGRATRAPLEEHRREEWRLPSTAWTPITWITQFSSPALTPEYSRGPQVGVELYYSNIASLTLNHYQQRTISLIQRISVDSIRVQHSSGVQLWSDQYQYLNTGNVRQIGWEGTGALTFGPVSVTGAYSWSDSRVTTSHLRSMGQFEYDVGAAFRYVPTHYGSLTINYAQGSTSISVVSNWVGASLRKSSDAPNWFKRVRGRLPMLQDRQQLFGLGDLAYRLKGYTKSDILITRTIHPAITATLNIQNVGNSYTSDWGPLFPTLGRQTILGVRLRYPSW